MCVCASCEPQPGRVCTVSDGPRGGEEGKKNPKPKSKPKNTPHAKSDARTILLLFGLGTSCPKNLPNIL